MADELRIEIEDQAAQAALARLIAKAVDLTPLMGEIAEYLVESTQKRFAQGQAPDGTPWLPLKDGSGRSPLLDTGTLRDQIFGDSGADWAEVAATARQARWHQEGTDPYEIRPQSGKALHWPGARHPVAKVSHPGLPAREFIGLSEEDSAAIVEMALAYMDEGRP